MAIIGTLVILLLWAAWFVMLFRFIISFVDPAGQTPPGAFVIGLTEPIYAPIRRLIPPVGLIDLAPLAAMLHLYILQMIFSAVWPS